MLKSFALFVALGIIGEAQTYTTVCTAATATCAITVTSGTVTVVTVPPPPPPPPPVGRPPVTDKFTSALVSNALWSFVNPVGDGTMAMVPGVKLTAPAGKNHDPAFGGNNSVRIRQLISDVDFSVITQFDSLPAASYQSEGVIVEQDATNYLRFQVSFDGTALTAYANAVVNGIDTNKASAIVTPAATGIWIAVVRAGVNWTMAYSLDNTNYIPLPSFSQTLVTRYIGPMAGNFNTTPAANTQFTASVNNFTNRVVPAPPPPPPPPPIPTPPPVVVGPVACNPTPSGTVPVPAGSLNVQGIINTATAGNNVVFADGTSSIPSALTLKPGVGYCGPASGTAVLQGMGGYPLMALAGNNITISGITLKAGGIHVTGSADTLLIAGNVIRDIQSGGVLESGANVTGIYQDRANGQQISNSSIIYNRLVNIYSPTNLTCDGKFPASGQPCDWYHDGMDFYNLSNVKVQFNDLDTIAGDAIHAFQEISCGQMGAPKVAQPNIDISFNYIRNNHRIPLEIQLCGTTGFNLSDNVITGTMIPNAWDIQISFASEGTGATVSRNYIDFAQGPSWSIPGTCLEIGATGTVADRNRCKSAIGSSGQPYFKNLSSVMGSNAVFTNNSLCGPFVVPLIIWEPPCTTGGCGAFQQTNNTVAASCAGFPAPPVVGVAYKP